MSQRRGALAQVLQQPPGLRRIDHAEHDDRSGQLRVDAGTGVIVNFSAGWGRSTAPEVAPYCATKWAVEGLTQALAEELPAGMAAVPLNPGVIHTDMLESCFGPDAGSYPHPDDWASRAVPFLLDLGAEHNGQPLTVPD